MHRFGIPHPARLQFFVAPSPIYFTTPMTARIFMIPGKARGHRPRLQHSGRRLSRKIISLPLEPAYQDSAQPAPQAFSAAEPAVVDSAVSRLHERRRSLPAAKLEWPAPVT